LIQQLQSELVQTKERESLLLNLNLGLQTKEVQLEGSLAESVRGQKDWQDKCEAMSAQLTLTIEERNQFVRKKEILEQEKSAWESLRVKQEKTIASKSEENQSLKTQM